MLNNLTIQGRLTAAPELRHTPNDVPVVSFTVACDRDYKAKDGGDRDKCDFIPCVAWRQLAEFIARNFGKGGSIVVSGRMTSRRYTDKDGDPHYAYECVADNVYFAGDSKKAQSAAAPAPVLEDLEYDDPDLPY